jgi:hypothetical protein
VFSLVVFAMFISRSLSIRALGITNTFLCFWSFIAYEALNTTGQGFNSWLGFEVGDANTILIEISRPGAMHERSPFVIVEPAWVVASHLFSQGRSRLPGALIGGREPC